MKRIIFILGFVFMTMTIFSQLIPDKIQAKKVYCNSIYSASGSSIAFANAVTMSSTLTVTGTVSYTGAASFGSTLSVTGAANFSSTVNSAGNFSVATSKFTVAANTGNTNTKGTLACDGDFKVDTNMFIVTASSGNVAFPGNLTINTNKFTVAAATGNTLVAGTFISNGVGRFDTNLSVSRKFTLTDTVWNHIFLSFADLKPCADSGKPDVDSARMQYLFPDGDTTEMLGGYVMLPNSWKSATNIYVDAIWSQSADDLVAWAVDYNAAHLGVINSGTYSTLCDSIPTHTYSSGALMQVTRIGVIAGVTTYTPFIKFKVYRKAVDSYAGDASFIGLRVSFVCDQVGGSTYYAH